MNATDFELLFEPQNRIELVGCFFRHHFFGRGSHSNSCIWIFLCVSVFQLMNSTVAYDELFPPIQELHAAYFDMSVGSLHGKKSHRVPFFFVYSNFRSFTERSSEKKVVQREMKPARWRRLLRFHGFVLFLFFLRCWDHLPILHLLKMTKLYNNISNAFVTCALVYATKGTELAQHLHRLSAHVIHWFAAV